MCLPAYANVLTWSQVQKVQLMTFFGYWLLSLLVLLRLLCPIYVSIHSFFFDNHPPFPFPILVGNLMYIFYLNVIQAVYVLLCF